MSLFPESPRASSIVITSVTSTLTSISHSFRRQARTRGGQRWLLNVAFPPMTRVDFAPVWAFSLSQEGQYGIFTYKPPIYKDTSGSATGTLEVNNIGGYEAGASTINVDGLTGNLKAGDFIKFAGHDKVYMLTADSTTTINIEPPLNANIADDEDIIYTDVPFSVAFASELQEVSTATNGLIGFDIKLVEVL